MSEIEWWLILVCAFAAVSYVGWGVTILAWGLDRQRFEQHRCSHRLDQ